MSVPKIEWKEYSKEPGFLRLDLGDVVASVSPWLEVEKHRDAPLHWEVCIDGGFWITENSVYLDKAKARAEMVALMFWKARQYDAAQKHEAELLSVAKVMYDLLVGIRQLGGHGGPVDDGFGGWEEGVALKARCQAAIKNAEGSK